MNKKERLSLKKDYTAIVNRYLAVFVAKQEIDFDYWIADDIGGVASFIEQYTFNFDDIRYDIDNNLKKGMILQWQDNYVDNHKDGDYDWINYKSYCMGLRLPLNK